MAQQKHCSDFVTRVAIFFFGHPSVSKYARKYLAALHNLTDFFEGFTAKPDIVIDDMPSTAQAPFVYNVHEEASWQSLAERIIDKHID